MANWYVKRGSQIAGPLTQQRLVELASQGKVQTSDLIREGEEGPFKPADQFPGLIPPAKSDNWDEFESHTHSQSTSTAPQKSKTPLIIILAILAGGFLLIIPILAALLLPAVQQARTAARRSQSKNNMKQIGLALHNYHDYQGVFPPGGTTTAEGKPYHAWQTSILPYMEQSQLYNEIDFDKPWDDPTNQFLFEEEIPQYLNPSIDETISPEGLGLSHYVGNELLLKKNSGLKLREVTDGASNTILASESGENFKPWADPTNIANPANLIGSGKKSSYPGGNNVLMSDGRVVFISENIDPAILEALSTPDGGEVVGEF